MNKLISFAVAGLSSLVFVSAAHAQTVPSPLDLQPYFPQNSQVVLAKEGSQTPATRYTFVKAPAGFQNLYNQFLSLNKPGYHYSWQKEYMINGSWCTKTYGILFFGTDKSVTEVGDWFPSGQNSCLPNTVFGYRNAANQPVGLLWSGVGGITKGPVVAEANVFRQATPGAAYASQGFQAYSKSGLIEVIPSMIVNGQTYQNVAHIVMYHGTKGPGTQRVRCDVPPISAQGAYYQSYKDFNSYAMELWLAPGVGVIREDTPFIEDGSYWAQPNCSGSLLTNIPWRTEAISVSTW